MNQKPLTVIVIYLTLAMNVNAKIFEPNLPSGSSYHLVFLSDTEDWAGPGDISSYDAIVTKDASADSDLVPLTWRVIGSTQNTAANFHADIQGAVFRIDGRQVATSGSDFWDGSISVPINVTPGGSRNVNERVWTGSAASGKSGKCGTTNGTTDCGLGRPDFANESIYGLSNSKSSEWIRGGEADLFSNYRFYAISESILIPLDACDVNRDGFCDVADIDAMTQMVINGTKTPTDRQKLIESRAPNGFHTYIGDANLDGVFDDQDFVKVFISGKYLTGQEASWGSGDWDGNLLFDDQDFVTAFISGDYLKRARRAVAAVPEPGGFGLLAIGLFAIMRRRQGTCR